jgi:uncharacterized membrane protein
VIGETSNSLAGKERPMNNRGWNVLAGIGLGAGLMYLLDPTRGKRRRKLLRDRTISVVHGAQQAIGKTARDVSQRAQGLAAEATHKIARDQPADEVLVERVRSRMGHFVSHPHAIDVEAVDGRVTLRGQVLAEEVKPLLHAVRGVPGVKELDNRLQIHRRPGRVPALQGGTTRIRARPALLGPSWSPSTRLLAGAAGSALMIYGLRRRGSVGIPAGLAGLAVLARSVGNLDPARMLGMSGGRRVIEARKTLRIAAPVEEVFGLWSRFENFPRFMSHLLEVRDLGDGYSHWVARAPMGAPVSWDAEITRWIPNRVLAWRSLPGSVVRNAGIIHFEPDPSGGTRVEIRLAYNPPGGVLGHFVARLFGADPRSEMDEDLLRLKSLIENGKTSAHGETVTREEVAV